MEKTQNIKKSGNLINKWANKMNRHFSTDKVQTSISMKKGQSH